MTGILSKRAPNNLGIFVVIPAHDEESLIPVANSLANCLAPRAFVEVLIVFNASEADNPKVKQKNFRAEEELLNWLKSTQVPPFLQFHTHTENELPKKHAGVGLARKIGMDEALNRFEVIGKEGLIVNLDADCVVAENYFESIERNFFLNPKTPGASIFFEHPLEDLNIESFNAIVNYELHLRYFINMQRISGFPWAFQTIGSAMVVRSSVYKQQGGMNKRKAGEDFYFLQKIIELGGFIEINDTTVFASARESHRVPFGTGKAVSDILQGKIWELYNPMSFELLARFFEIVEGSFGKGQLALENIFAEESDALRFFLQEGNWIEKILDCSKYTKDRQAFIKRFYRSFNAFQLMKFCHYIRDHHFPNVSYARGVSYLFEKLNLPLSSEMDKNLKVLKEYDRQADYML